MAKVSDHFINLSFYLKYIPKMRLSFNVFTVENFRLIDEKYKHTDCNKNLQTNGQIKNRNAQTDKNIPTNRQNRIPTYKRRVVRRPCSKKSFVVEEFCWWADSNKRKLILGKLWAAMFLFALSHHILIFKQAYAIHCKKSKSHSQINLHNYIKYVSLLLFFDVRRI